MALATKVIALAASRLAGRGPSLSLATRDANATGYIASGTSYEARARRKAPVLPAPLPNAGLACILRSRGTRERLAVLRRATARLIITAVTAGTVLPLKRKRRPAGPHTAALALVIGPRNGCLRLKAAPSDFCPLLVVLGTRFLRNQFSPGVVFAGISSL